MKANLNFEPNAELNPKPHRKLKPKQHLRRSFVALALVLSAAAAGSPLAWSQELKGPIRIVVGYPPGGTADAVARAYADELRQRLGVAVVVDNRAGAGGQIAAEGVKAAAPDGTVLLLANSHMMATLPLTTRSIKYDPIKDFEPVSRLASFDLGLIVSSASPARSLADHVALVRADPTKGGYGIPAPGSSPQFIGFSIARKEGISLTAVPYRGGAPLTLDLLGGQVPAGIDAIGSVLEHVRSGKLRVLAVGGPRRVPWLPDVPTFAELGYANLDRSSWMGLFAPLNTPAALVQRLNQAVVAAAAEPKMAAGLDKQALVPVSSSPQELREAIRQELGIWGPIIKASGYQAE